MHTPASPDNDDTLYLALKARDARFDGHFFTAVTSTGIYCRPVCRVRTPKRENCRFFALAAQAEAQGFRPCLRCRPELAPGNLREGQAPWSHQDASAILAHQAQQLLDSHTHWSDTALSIPLLADKLGISDRHLRRIFEAQWGISPLQYLQTRRLLCAKQLLTDTQLPMAQVALLSGFASVRRFNAVFSAQYRMQPRTLRATGTSSSTQAQVEGIQIRATYRPPLHAAHLFEFFARRAIPGVELVDSVQGCFQRTLCWKHGDTPLQGWVHAQLEPARHGVLFRISPTLAPALAALLPQLRAWLDLEADPRAIDAVLEASFPDSAGMRVPGTLDGFELAVRAILGQQITVQAARTLTQRLVERYGTPIVTPWSALNRCFPTAAQLSTALAEDLGALGIVRQRQQALLALARAVMAGQLHLHPAAEVASTMEALQSLPGVGPWTANYIAMRALRWPDAFPSGDVALQKALGVQEAKNPAKAAELASQSWRPWRSYAVVRAWNTLS